MRFLLSLVFLISTLADGSTVKKTRVDNLYGRPLSSTAPSNGDVITWNSSLGRWAPAASGSGSSITVDTITAITGTQSLAFGSGNMIFDSSGDINFNANNTPYRMNFGTNNIRLFSMSGSTTTVLEFREIGGGNYIALKGPSPIGGDVTFTLPAADGTDGQVMYTDASGQLAFKTAFSPRASCSPTLTVASGTTDASTIPSFCWREGDSLVIEGMAKIGATGGTGGAVVRLVLPSGQGYVIDTAKLSNGTANSNDASTTGPCTILSAATYRTICPFYYSTTEIQFTNGAGMLTGADLIANAEMRFLIKVPIDGWD